MAQKGPIIIIEDDLDDQFILTEIFKDIGISNPLKFFSNSPEAYQYLVQSRERPFLIISDVNLPGMDGHDLLMMISENAGLRKKSIPFIFLTNSANRADIEKAYNLMPQGYFKKPDNVPEIKKTLQLITDYWSVSLDPNSYE